MWTRHASRAAEKSFLSVLIQVSVIFSTIARPDGVVSLAQSALSSLQCRSRFLAPATESTAVALNSDVLRGARRRRTLLCQKNYGRGATGGVIPLIFARGLVRSTRIGSRVTTSFTLPAASRADAFR